MTAGGVDARAGGRRVTATPLLELRAVTKSYGHVKALRGCSFSVSEGETVGLLGDNGAGKSTLIKAISGVVLPDEGSILWRGEPVVLRSRRDSAALGIEPIFQDGALCEALPIWRNMFLGRESTSRWGLLRRAEMKRDALQMMQDTVHIGTHIDSDQPVGELSGGQRQAVAIARAVHFKRSLLLLDEPTSALGVRETQAVLDYVTKLSQEGVSSVLVTHNLYHAYQVCQRFVVVSHGLVTLDVARDDIGLDDLTKLVIAA
jgi:simple sugar transport system ATP-binding protein